MKVTYTEEIESHRAWFAHMYCPKCDEGIYEIHHQLSPIVDKCWWLECPNCGFESVHTTTCRLAINGWSKGEEEC